MGIRNLGICLGEAAPEAFIGVTKAHVARLLFGWGRSTIRLFVTVGWRCWGGWSLDQVPRRAARFALISSGRKPLGIFDLRISRHQRG
jgi:hypothetical protein